MFYDFSFSELYGFILPGWTRLKKKGQKEKEKKTRQQKIAAL